MTMLIELLAFGWLRANEAAGAAVLVVAATRGLVRRRFGADAAYRLWLTPPAAALASLFPGPHLLGEAPHARLMDGEAAAWATPFVVAWLIGAAAAAMHLVVSDAVFRRSLAQGRAGPAAAGALWPRIVLPHDFATRFTPGQRELILAHERAHVARGDTRTALVIAVAQALAWFNPLAHLAARLARLDQELACDAQVLCARPQARRAYAEALIAAQRMPGRPGAASCGWWGRHPIEARVRALQQRGAPAGGGMAHVLPAGPLLMALVVWAIAPPSGMDDTPLRWPHAQRLLFVDLRPSSSFAELTARS